MDLEGKTIVYEASRVIGLNDADLEKLSREKTVVPVEQQTTVETPMPEVAPAQEAVVTPEVTPVTPEAVVQAAPTATNEEVVSDVVDAVKNEEATNVFENAVAESVQAPAQEAVAAAPVEEKNIFDMPMPEVVTSEVSTTPEIAVPNVDIPAVDVTSNLNSAVVEEPTVTVESATEPVLETPTQFYQNESDEQEEIVYLDKIRNAIITLKEENDRLKAENSELKNQISIANQRVIIAEQQRAAQVTGIPVEMQTPNNESQTMTQSQAA